MIKADSRKFISWYFIFLCQNFNFTLNFNFFKHFNNGIATCGGVLWVFWKYFWQNIWGFICWISFYQVFLLSKFIFLISYGGLIMSYCVKFKVVLCLYWVVSFGFMILVCVFLWFGGVVSMLVLGLELMNHLPHHHSTLHHITYDTPHQSIQSISISLLIQLHSFSTSLTHSLWSAIEEQYSFTLLIFFLVQLSQPEKAEPSSLSSLLKLSFTTL